MSKFRLKILLIVFFKRFCYNIKKAPKGKNLNNIRVSPWFLIDLLRITSDYEFIDSRFFEPILLNLEAVLS